MLRNLYRRFDRYYIGQIHGGDCAKICGLLKIYELYLAQLSFDDFFGGKKNSAGCLLHKSFEHVVINYLKIIPRCSERIQAWHGAKFFVSRFCRKNINQF